MNKELLLKVVNNFGITILCLIYASLITLSILSVSTPDFLFIQKINWIEILSLIIFISTFFFGCKNLKWYAIFLIFNLLAMPSSIDNLLPSVLVSSLNDINRIFYPIITHIDIYIIFGIFKYSLKPNLKIIKHIQIDKYLVLMLFSISLLTVSVLANIYTYNSIYDIGLILAYSFHIRYALLLILLFLNTNILNYKDEFFIGIIISIIFLFFESIAYSYIFNDSVYRLVSGTLRNNTFANILSAIFCYLIFLLVRKKVSVNYGFLVMAIFLAIIYTKTRSALFLAIFYIAIEFFLFMIRLVRHKKRKKSFYFGFLFIATLVLFIGFLSNNERLSIFNFKVNNFDLNQDNFNDIIQLENNEFNQSLILRMDHFQTSLNMMKEHPIVGIGPGRWNKYKENFGSNSITIMDSHNDLLAFASQYGMFQGIIFCFSLYFISYFIYKKRIKKGIHNGERIEYLFIINLVMFFAGITNAGLWKHQVFAFLLLITMLFIFDNQEKVAIQNKKDINFK